MKTKHILLTATLSLLSISFVFSQQEYTGPTAASLVQGASMVYIDHQTGSPAFIQLRDDYTLTFTNFQLWFSKIFKTGTGFSLQLTHTEKDNLGMTHYKYQELNNGYPVDGGIIIAHVKDGLVRSINGKFFKNVTPASANNISEHDALQAVLNSVDAKTYKWEVASEEQHLKEIKNNQAATYFPVGKLTYVPQDGKYYEAPFVLAWQFDVYAQDPMSRQYMYVDANSGQILYSVNMLETATGTAVTTYSGTQVIETTNQAGGYVLQEASRGAGNGMVTLNLQTGTNYGSAIDFTDADNYWNNVNPQQDQVATDAHWGAEMTYDYYYAMHGRNSFDDAGGAIYSYVHYDVAYDNAFWDGTQMTYGDGSYPGNSGGYLPFTSIDVCGHEVSHAVTQYTANLNYADESGALNEANSDMMGNTIEAWARPTQHSWNIAEDIDPYGAGGFRNMANPKQFGQPDTYLGQNWQSGGGDNGGVHTNSGVANYWYYLVSNGGSGTNDNNDTYSVTGVGMVDAANIEYRALSVYETPTTQYFDARVATIQAAIDLFGPCSPQLAAVTEAWYAVGVGASYNPSVIASFVADPPFACQAPATFTFTNQSSNAGSYIWDFGDGATSNAVSPTHTYNADGSYTIKLIASGGTCGSDTLVCSSCISVDPSNPCIVDMPASGTGVTQTACTGLLYDSGGPNGNYPDNASSAITISPTGATKVFLYFMQFHFEQNYDSLFVFDGPSTGSPLIGGYTGTSLPGNGVLSSTGGSITLKYTSDVALNYEGFALAWVSTSSSCPPGVFFNANVTETCSGTVNFTDLSSNSPTSWLWNFGDGGTSSLQNPTHTYASNGSYTVQLTATGPTGSGLFVRTSYITVDKPDQLGAPDVIACAPASVTLNATPAQGGTIKWYDQPNATVPIAVGNSYVTPVLNSPTTYYCEETTPVDSGHVGPLDNNIGSGNNYNNDTRYELFDVYQPCILKSVWVLAQGAGNRVISLRDASDNVIQEVTVFVPDGGHRVNVNIPLSPGTNYHLGVGAGSLVDVWRSDGGINFPYTLAGMVTITNSNTGNYYYWYDWDIVTQSCVSLRTDVLANVIDGSVASISPAGPTTICQNTSVVLTASPGTGYAWSNGSTNQSITVSTAGTYTVTVTVDACVATASTTIAVSPTPFVQLGNDISTCFGPVLLDATTPNVIHYNWSTGDTTPTLSVTQSGIYHVTVTSPAGCHGSDLVEVTIGSENPVTLGNDIVTCNSSTTLNAGSGFTTYTWSDGSTTQTINVNSGGTYSVTALDVAGCTSTDNVSVTFATPPSLDLGNDVTGCAGTNIFLDAGTGFESYNWSDGQITQLINVITGGTYSCTVTDANGCTASDDVSVAVFPNPPTPTITQTGDVLTTDAGYVSYDWYFNGGFLITTSVNTLSITQSGNYEVFVNDNHGCNALSAQFAGVYTGIESLDAKSFSIYPNPTDSRVFVLMNSVAIDRIEVTNMLGETMMNEINVLSKGNPVELNLGNLTSGVYFITLHSGDSQAVQKIVLQK